MQLVPVLFYLLALVLASSNTNESNLPKNRERSRTESYVSTARSSLIPVPNPGKPQINTSTMAYSYRSYSDKIIFSPKDFDKEKSLIARMELIEQYLRDMKPSDDAKETAEDAKKEEDSSSSSDDDENGNDEKDEELMFEMDPFETGLTK